MAGRGRRRGVCDGIGDAAHRSAAARQPAMRWISAPGAFARADRLERRVAVVALEPADLALADGGGGGELLLRDASVVTQSEPEQTAGWGAVRSSAARPHSSHARRAARE